MAVYEAISFSLNGKEVEVRCDPDRSLMDVLREDFDDISPKNGCAPQAQCGCCTVLVDGGAKLSCVQKIGKMAGKKIMTLVGVPEEERGLIAECFTRAGGLQCGFCIPGMAMRGLDLVNKEPNPTREQIANSLKQHLCRCTGYVKIIDSIEMLAAAKRGEALPEADESGLVGTRMERYRGREFALGDFRYVDDIKVPGMLYAAMAYSEHPRATIKGIDTAAARAMEGVKAVFTAADIPGERYVGLIVKDWPVMVAIGEEARYQGDVLAVAVAETQALAREAALKVAIDYEVLTPLSTPQMALAPDAPKLHPKGNLLSRSAVLRGDVEQALAGSAFVVEGDYQTQPIEHMFLEPEACIAIPHSHDGNGTPGLQILSQGQGVFDDQRQIAALLGWERAQVQVRLISNGGAFGGKEDMSIQGQTSLAAALLGVPVKCTLTREESFRMHPKRHALQIHMKLGCDAEGHLTGLYARIIGDKGCYASVGAKVVERAAGHATGPYKFPSVDIESLAVYTNNPPCGAMRGFGANQSAFAVEQLLNKLAKLVGIDQWEMRWRNILDQGDVFCTGQRLTKPIGLRKTLKAVEAQFKNAKYAGIACGIKNVGIGNGMPDNGKCVMRVEPDGKVFIRTGFTEMGQGYFTICIQTAVQETGLPPATFTASTETSAEVDCGQTTASRATVLGCLAVMDAAKKLKAELDAGKTLAEMAGTEFRGEVSFTYTDKLGAHVEEPKTHISYGFATQVVILDDDGKVSKVIAAHDVGKVMNPTLLEGQMEGSLHMGLGYALSEDFAIEGSYVKAKHIRDLNVLRAHHMPELELIFIEEPDPETPYGARGVGEIGLVPTAPAVAGALEAYDGIHRVKLPMKDSEAGQSIVNFAWKPKSLLAAKV